jgi:hypothetical protein
MLSEIVNVHLKEQSTIAFKDSCSSLCTLWDVHCVDSIRSCYSSDLFRMCGLLPIAITNICVYIW